jgi:Potential Queuosine, Q, salvage protein family
MATRESWQDDAEGLYTLPLIDPLGVLSSTQQVVEQGEFVWINPDQVEALCQRWLHQDVQQVKPHTHSWDTHYHFYDATERSVNWLLVLDALNFCFWAEKGQKRWTIEYQGEILNGYWAEAAALKRAAEENIPLWDAQFLSTISEETIAHIFRGNGTIPLLEQRVANTREVGRVLLANYQGQFSTMIEQAQGSAVKLVLSLVQHFPSFNDAALYRTQTIRFYKRAQICVADLHSAFSTQPWGTFDDLEQLTIFADYKLPQVLRHANILEYQTTLAERVDNRELITSGSEEEVEIRAATIWACELLRRTMLQHGHTITAAEIDLRLWLLGQQTADMRPYHRTRTIYY